MNVAVVAEHIDTARGGAERSTVQFLQNLVALGVRLRVYTRSVGTVLEGVEIERVDPEGAIRGLRTLAFSREVDHRFEQHCPDVVHAITPCLSADIYQPRGGTFIETMERNVALRRSPVARHLKRLANRFNLKQRTMLKLERDLIMRPRPPVVIAISEYVAGQLDRHYRVPPERVVRIFNGVDPPDLPADRVAARQRLRERLDISEHETLAILVAHNYRLKGVARWLEAVAQERGGVLRGWRSLIIGRDRGSDCPALARRLGLDGLVTFTGPVDDMPAVLCAADVLVHPTYYDPCSRVVLEALLSGVPCVTTRFNGAAEVIEDGVTGRVIESPDDTTALATAAAQVSAVTYRAALDRTHAVLVSRLSMARHAREVFELYERLRSP